MERIAAYPTNEHITLNVNRAGSYFYAIFADQTVFPTGESIKSNLDGSQFSVDAGKAPGATGEFYYIRWAFANEKSAEILAALDALMQLTGKPESFATAGAPFIPVKATPLPFMAAAPAGLPAPGSFAPTPSPFGGLPKPAFAGFPAAPAFGALPAAPAGAPMMGFPGMTSPFNMLAPGIGGMAPLSVAAGAPGKGGKGKAKDASSMKLLATNERGWQLYSFTKGTSFFIPMSTNMITELPTPKSLVAFEKDKPTPLGLGYKVWISGRTAAGRKVYPGAWLDTHFPGWDKNATHEDARKAYGDEGASATPLSGFPGAPGLQTDGDALALNRLFMRASQAMTREELRAGDTLVVLGPTAHVQPTLEGQNVQLQFAVSADRMIALIRVPVQVTPSFPAPLPGAPPLLPSMGLPGRPALPFAAMGGASAFAAAPFGAPTMPTFPVGVPGSPSRPPAPPTLPGLPAGLSPFGAPQLPAMTAFNPSAPPAALPANFQNPPA